MDTTQACGGDTQVTRTKPSWDIVPRPSPTISTLLVIQIHLLDSCGVSPSPTDITYFIIEYRKDPLNERRIGVGWEGGAGDGKGGEKFPPRGIRSQMDGSRI